MSEAELIAEAQRLHAEVGLGHTAIAHRLQQTRQWVRKHISAETGPLYLAAEIDRHSAVALYDAACRALAAAKTIVEVKDIADRSAALKEYGRLAKDRQLEVQAAELRIRSERRLGEMLLSAKAEGHLTPGRRWPEDNGSQSEPLSRVTLEAAGIDKKLSSRSQRLASISEQAMEARVSAWRSRAEAESLRVTANLMRDGDKREQREQRERDLATKINAGNLTLPTRKYGVILADPGWRFEPRSRITGMDRAADNHYPTTPTDKIAALDVASVAAKDAVLFLWATGPMIQEALMVMDAWGFEYKSQMIWGKPQIGPGYWFREQHELLLVGTCGKVVAPAPGTQPGSMLIADRTRHSAKPAEVYQIIERWYPNVPKIELNARNAREGWDVWGLDAPDCDPDTGEITEAAE